MTVSITPKPQTVDISKTHGDWRDDLFRDGYVVVKNVISKERCKYYVDKMFEWIERFPFGFDRNDRSTWTPEHLPTHMKGGMYHGYRIQHERFMWEARTEPGVLEAFTKLWGTDELLSSFDGMNFTLPSGTQLPPTDPWPHVDQSPKRFGMQCVQGILNFVPNGPDDGGLIVMKGSNAIMEEFFASHPEAVGRAAWTKDWFGFELGELGWFEERGCEILKVCAEEGDLILWDSRTLHFNQVPKSQNVRAIMYTCYTPVSSTTPEVLRMKAGMFTERAGSTHWPHDNLVPTTEKKPRLGKVDAAERDRPFEEPKETQQVLRLAGKLAY